MPQATPSDERPGFEAYTARLLQRPASLRVNALNEAFLKGGTRP